MVAPTKLGRFFATAASCVLFAVGCGGGGGGAPATYSIGGTITGLTGAGLVLANGNDTLKPAAGATSFAFATAVASGSGYAVTVKTQPNGELCQVADGAGQVANAAVTNVAVSCAHPWTWVGGANTLGATGVYGALGTAAAGNVPGARLGALSWTDSVGNLWLFGGTPNPANVTESFNDLWRYSPGSGLWTWVSGSSSSDAPGVYGTQGVASAANGPGARNGGVSWIDAAGDLWLFGGAGYDAGGTFGHLNDLWRYSPGSGQWTWVSGANTVESTGLYGVKGVAAAGNTPGARWFSVSWSDSAGDLWLLGGAYGTTSAAVAGELNDLWRYSPSSGQWTWVSGSSTPGAQGSYGVQGTAAAGNVPGARYGSISWTDAAGDLWLFAGQGRDSAGTFDVLNDLWRYSPSSGQWTWVSGSNTVHAIGMYGIEGIASAGTVPGARFDSVSWIDGAGDLWLFGGIGVDANNDFPDLLNDLWRYSPGSGQWTWVSGSPLAGDQGNYGTQGVAAAGNIPPGRSGSVSWIDGAGRLWLFGGAGGYDAAGGLAVRNDLWVY